MKTLSLLLFLICLSLVARGQEVWTEVDLHVNGISSGTSYSKIAKRVGTPSRVRKIGFDDCGGGFLKTLYYSGLKIGVLSDAKGRNYKVISIEVTSSKWKIAPRIRIGSDKGFVRSKFGKPISGWPGKNVLDYVTKENLGGVTFFFNGTKLIRVTMQETLC